jgi:hypothetical protein
LRLGNCSVHRSKAFVNFFAKNSIIRVPLCLTVLTWHFLTSDFRVNEGCTGRTTVPWARGPSHWHS